VNGPAPKARGGIAGRVAYAALFGAVLPVLLAAWAARLDALVSLPQVGTRAGGVTIAAAGVLCMAAGMLALWTWGRGLPMSPFPPRQLVTRGIYRLTADPIYVGAVAVAAGVAIAARSPAGLWIVTPVLAMAAVAWVLGFERDLTRRRFGTVDAPLLRLPAPVDDPPSGWARAAVYALVLAPWLVAYFAVERLGAPADARSTYLEWEARLPVLPWTEAVYLSTYLFVLLAPLAARRARDLRTFALRGAWATALIIPFYLLVPLVAEAKPVPGDGLWQALMRWERVGDAPVTAFPAFHLLWACLAADLYVASFPRWRAVFRTMALAIAVSCVTTGMHAALDVAGGFAAYGLLTRDRAIGRLCLRWAEYVANSWREVSLGPVRLLSHGLYAGAGVIAGLAIAVSLAGTAQLGWLAAVAIATTIGAGAWAQLVEGSPQLLRPYGYFGGIAGGGAVAVVAGLVGADGWTILAATAVGSSVTQAIGRLRCLVQGCCHGRPAPDALGIRYQHPRSRVVRLAGLGGTPVYPTPLYSLLWMLAVAAILWRLWMLAAPLPLIAGFYLILAGAGRFVEEHFRGEPQTAEYFGLRLYQWLAIAFVVGGAAMTGVDARRAAAIAGFDPAMIPVLLVVGVVTYAAFGVDFPRSNRRLARLT
jgi:protein-S-isoprenylcysteine O-methyltransferase Ste14